MSDNTIKATSRSVEGKGASRRLRRDGAIPGIVYGGKAEPQLIQLDQEKIWLAQQNEWFYSSILDLDIDGKVVNVLLRDIQRHPYKQLIMHLDFQRIDQSQALRTTVPLHFVNEETSPAGKNAEVIVMKELNQVEVSCLPKDLPENIVVDLSGLDLGDTIHLSQIQLPEGVEIPALALGPDQDIAVVVARKGRTGGGAEDEEGAEGAEGTEGESAGE